MNKNFKILGVVMLGFMSFSCNNNQGNNSSEATTPVWVEEVQHRNIEEYITTTGTAKAAKTIEIKSETNGAYYLQKNPKTGRPYQLGDIVEAGAVIIRLENKEYENNVQLEITNPDHREGMGRSENPARERRSNRKRCKQR